ncbi:MAG TPA: ABC transporter permease subunit [Actinomycetota bacterium]|nr:ABC transporter permease subunit [Actinomycetota bacterium]
MAVVRDERSLLEVQAAAGTARQADHPWRRRLLWAAAIVVAIVVGLLAFPNGFPSRLTFDAATPLNNANNWVIAHQLTNPVFVHVLNPIKNTVNTAVDQLVKGMARLTWIGMLTLVVAVAGYFAGWRKAVLAAVGFLAIGVLGYWSENLDTLALVLLSVLVALAIGIPVGILSARHRRVEQVLRPVLDAMQTVPAFSYLIIVVLLFSIGAMSAMVATVIFALPPAIRLTSLGIRQVPSDAVEAGLAFGVTKRQLLRKVQLPLAKPAIMVGVNQTIMMALGIVVIAATIGYGGLGGEVLEALQRLQVGRALAAGLALVAVAIVLDRVTFGWSEAGRSRRGSSTARIFGWTVSRRVLAVLLGVAVIGAIFVGRQVLRQQDFPDQWVVSIAQPVDHAEESITGAIGTYTRSLSDGATRWGLVPLRDLLQDLPWWMVCLGAAVGAYAAARRVPLAIASFVLIAAIGFMGQWENAMDTLSQVIIGVIFSVAIGIPLGIWASRSDRVQRVMKPILDGMQTLPQFVYLVPVIALFHVGRIPGIIAALIYALPPCIRLTDLGIRQVPHDRVEAAVSFGATKNQLLRKVQLPLAKPSIMLGVNQTIMMVLSVVIIAGLVGGEGLGYQVINGLSHDFGTGLVAGICILLLAIVIDRITQAMGQPAGRATKTPHGVGWFFGPSRTRRMAVDIGGEEIPGEIPAGKGEA